MKGKQASATSKQKVYSMESGIELTLHTTLPLQDLLAVFENELRQILLYDSFEYEHDRSGTHLFQGTPKLHKCQYRINTKGIDLGQITLTRRKPFDEREILLIERALGALIIHLGNAYEQQMKLDEEQLRTLQADAQLAGCP